MNLRHILVLSSIALAAMAPAQEYALKRDPKLDAPIRYKVRAELTFGEVLAVMTGVSTEKITKIEADGSFISESTSSDAKVEMEGKPYDVPKEAPLVKTFTATGDITTITGSRIDSSVYRMANVAAFRVPPKPMKVGESWTKELVADARTGAAAAKCTYTFEAIEDVSSIKCAKVKMVYTEAVDRTPATAEGHFWISTIDGSLVKSDLNVKNAPFTQSPVPVNARIVVTRE